MDIGKKVREHDIPRPIKVPNWPAKKPDKEPIKVPNWPVKKPITAPSNK